MRIQAGVKYGAKYVLPEAEGLAVENRKSNRRFPVSHRQRRLRAMRCLRTIARRTRSARSFSVPRVHPQMERPGFESSLCASSTNRSLYATLRKLLWTGAPFFIEE